MSKEIKIKTQNTIKLNLLPKNEQEYILHLIYKSIIEVKKEKSKDIT